MDLTVIGAGYVGLVTAVVFANFGHKIWVIDLDKKRIKRLTRGRIPFYEPGIEPLLQKNLKSGRLRFTDDYSVGIPEAEVLFICVGTPNKNGEINLDYLYSAAKSVASNLQKPAIVVIKSTVPPGTDRNLARYMAKFTKVNFDLASVPEFLSEGKALEGTLYPDRVVIGAEKEVVKNKLLELHKKIGGERIMCDSTSAQMIKYASNAFLPMKITFANSIGVLCDEYGADAKAVMKGLGLDHRIGRTFWVLG